MTKHPLPEAEPPRTYTPQCLVLVTEIRTCTCGEVYRSPNPALLVESTCDQSYRRREYKPGKEDLAGLYRRKMEINTKTFACERCFVPDKGDYPRPRPQPRNLKQGWSREGAKPKTPIKQIALEDL